MACNAFHCWRLGAVVEVFEPNPMCGSVLGARGSRKPRSDLYAVELSDMAGTAHLHIPVDASASNEKDVFVRSRDQSIPLQTLSSFDVPDANFIKLDFEGHESKVIRGAVATHVKSRTALLVDIEERRLASPVGEVLQQVEDHRCRGFLLEYGHLSTLAEFNPKRHQVPVGFDSPGKPCINKFMFPYEMRLQSGEGRSLTGSLGD